MPVDLRAAIRGALDVQAPGAPIDGVRRRAAAHWLREHRRRVRSMLAAAVLLVAGAVFAGGCSSVDAAPAHVAAVPAPAPVPIAT